MTVGELIEKLREYDPECEVMVSVCIENDVYDALALDSYMQAGYAFVSGVEA